MRVVRFYIRCPAPPPSPPSSPDLHCQLWIAVGLAGPHLPALDRSGHRRTSTASSRSQWASPDLDRRKSACCGPRRASTGEIQSTLGLARPQPAKFCGLTGPQPDLNRTSTGPQRPETKPYRMPKRMPDRMSEDMPDRNLEDVTDRMSEDMPDIECQIECQKICQIEI